MKKVQLLIFGLALFLLGSSSVSAQSGVSINVNLQPQWGPVEYDYVEYYYMPEYDLYYYAPQRQFVYLKGNKWITVNALPNHYQHVNLYNTYKVVINEPRPYLKHSYYSNHYKQYKGQHSKQVLIRDSKDAKYGKHNDSPTHSSDERAVRAQQRKVQIQGNKNDKGGHQSKGKGNKKH